MRAEDSGELLMTVCYIRQRIEELPWTLILLLAVYIAVLANVAFADSDELSARHLAVTTIDKINSMKFDLVFRSFYLPPEYSHEDTEFDREAIQVGLEDLFGSELGSISDCSVVKYIDNEVVTLSLATGTEQTLSLPAENVIYKVNYGNFGAGYLIFGIYRNGSKLLLKSISVGLPVADIRSIKISRYFADIMAKLAADQHRRVIDSPRNAFK